MNLLDYEAQHDHYMLDAIRKQSEFELYPKQEYVPSYTDKLQEEYNLYYAQDDLAKLAMTRHNAFLEDCETDLVSLGLYTAFVSPVLESLMASTREHDVAATVIEQFVNDHNAHKLLEQFEYTNSYLADLSKTVRKHYNKLVEACNCKIKEGLPEEEVNKIEDRDIKSFVLDCKHCCPKDITSKITKRVEDAVNDFIDDKKKSQYEISQIYQRAKQKVQDYNNSMNPMGGMMQTDGDTSGMDPEVNIDANLNAKLDSQQNQEIANMGNPDMQAPPNAMRGETGTSMMTPAQEAMAWARHEEAIILEDNYSVFDAMVRILVESTYKHQALKETYEGDNGRTDIQKVINDVRAMYTVLESWNVLNIIDVNEEYLENMLHDMEKFNLD